MTAAGQLRQRLGSLDFRPELRQGVELERAAVLPFQLHKVSARGQFVLPLSSRPTLGIGTSGKVDIRYSDVAVVVRRALDPQQRTSVPSAPGWIRYQVSDIGQMSLPAEARRSWGMGAGGHVEVGAIGRRVIVLPLGAASTILSAWLGSREEESPFVVFHGLVLGSGEEVPRTKVLQLSPGSLGRLLCIGLADLHDGGSCRAIQQADELSYSPAALYEVADTVLSALRSRRRPKGAVAVEALLEVGALRAGMPPSVWFQLLTSPRRLVQDPLHELAVPVVAA